MTFFKQHKPGFILVVGDEGTLFVPLHVAEPKAAIFAAAGDDDAEESIQKILTVNPYVPVTLLANNAAQEFRVDKVPPLNILDRPKLLQRRLQQAFPKAYANAYRMLDRSHVVLASLQQGGPLAEWCRLIPPYNLSLGSLPIEGAELVTHLMPDAKQGWAMLLANCATGGLRQIVTCNGQLVFARQTKALDVEGGSKKSVTALKKVITETRGYLSRFGLGESTAMRVALLFSLQDVTALNSYAIIHGMTLYSPRQAAEKLRLPLLPDEDSGDGDLVFAGWVAARGALWLPLLPTGVRVQHQTNLIARIGMWAALAVLAVALIVTGWSASHLFDQLINNHHEAQNLDTMRDHLAAQQAALAPTAKPLGRLRAALERRQLFAETQDEPWAALRRLGPELGGHARLTNLDWRDDVLRVTLRLDVAENEKAPDRESIVRNFTYLANHLARMMPGYNVEVSRYPFPATPEETLTNAGGDPSVSSEPPTAEMTIRKQP